MAKWTAFPHLGETGPMFVDESAEPIGVGAKLGRRGIDVRREAVHHHPQQSVLKRQDGQRRTACIRYMSAPQRSHFIASSSAVRAVVVRKADTTGVTTTPRAATLRAARATFSGALSTPSL